MIRKVSPSLQLLAIFGSLCKWSQFPPEDKGTKNIIEFGCLISFLIYKKMLKDKKRLRRLKLISGLFSKCMIRLIDRYRYYNRCNFYWF